MASGQALLIEWKRQLLHERDAAVLRARELRYTAGVTILESHAAILRSKTLLAQMRLQRREFSAAAGRVAAEAAVPVFPD